MDREIAPAVRRNQFLRRGAVVVFALAVAGISLAATVEWLRPSIRRRDVLTARVERGTVDASLQATGTVVPAFEQAVSSPVEARVLRIVRRAGDRVKAGDDLIALDTAQSHLDFERVRESRGQKESETTQLRLSLEETVAGLRASIEQKKLDVEILRYRAEQNRTLRTAGLVSEEAHRASETEAKKSAIELTQLAEALERAQRKAEAQLAAAANDLRMLAREEEESRRQLELAKMRSDRAGVVTWIVQEEGATVRRGDVIARIADLSSFRVRGSISDLHAARLVRGMRVRVRLEDGTTIGGSIAGIEPRIEGGQVPFHVDLDVAAHPKLRNAQRADVFVIEGTRRDVLRVRRGALAQREFEDVFVIRGDQAESTRVRWGLSGEENVEVREGLRDGDEVILSDMTAHEGVKRLRIK